MRACIRGEGAKGIFPLEYFCRPTPWKNMKQQPKTFQHLDELQAFLQQKKIGHILIGYRNLPDYAGMVLGLGIIFNTEKPSYELDLQWVSFGLDVFGENLLENYLYRFLTLEELLAYLEDTYQIGVTDIPLRYQIDQDAFPNPIKDSAQKPLYEAAWQQFQSDFETGKFLDEALQLVFSSQPSQ
jgi:hypothetical protein